MSKKPLPETRMENTRMELTKGELRLLLSIAPGGDLRKAIESIANVIRTEQHHIQIGQHRETTYNTHIPFDEEDWNEICGWIERYGHLPNNRQNGRRATKKSLILHVAERLSRVGRSD